MSEQREKGGPRRVRFGTDGFNKTLEEAAAAVEKGAATCLVFLGSSGNDLQPPLSALADRMSLDLYQRDAAELIGERTEQTRGNLREAFDNAGDVPTILCFKNADAVIRASDEERRKENLDRDARTVKDYLYDRIEHKPGVTILHLSEDRYAEEVAERLDADVVEV